MPPLHAGRPGPLLVLLAVTLAATTVVASDTVPFYPSAEEAAAVHCEGTLYPELCLSTLADIPDLHKKSLPDVICGTVNRTKDAVAATSYNCSHYINNKSLTARDRLAISDCMELLDTTMDELQATTNDLESPVVSSNNGSASMAAKRVTMDHVMTVLSAAMTNQYTCLDGFDYKDGGKARHYMEPGIHHVSHMVSNSLAMAKKLPGAGGGGTNPSPSTNTATQLESETTQRQPFMGYGQMVNGFPRWVKPGDRRLLQAPASGITPDAVVAKDGSGGYTTVSAAVAAAPSNSKKRYVIHIKAGAYMENVEVGKSKRNLMFIGDGIGKTVIKASRNVVDGSTTFRSATVEQQRHPPKAAVARPRRRSGSASYLWHPPCSGPRWSSPPLFMCMDIFLICDGFLVGFVIYMGGSSGAQCVGSNRANASSLPLFFYPFILIGARLSHQC
ncbi:hypothetical protein E2562_010800 [Oryza meyeriana var. granulata]|uniref:pectinesterase n=1 Tax=Oryza meyeriana var. granulata TaxID=110450 RepID=A0A6G1BJX3_9ORYZ|nr:hypothetical protein E2562_010800 [Oryza meyeriana var. granulata]